MSATIVFSGVTELKLCPLFNADYPLVSIENEPELVSVTFFPRHAAILREAADALDAMATAGRKDRT